jgi:hypothetical protein
MSELPDDTPLTVGAMRAMLRDRSRLFKNGESWADYIREKWLTPQNLLIVVMAVFTVGGRVQEVQTGVAAAIAAAEAAMAATEAQEKLAVELTERTRAVDEQLDKIEKNQDLYATKVDSEAVKKMIKDSVSRREWRELIDIQQQANQRLARIEKSIGDQR